MKKILRVFSLIAVTAIIASCADNKIEAPVKEFTHTVLIHAGQPSTRTLINEGISEATFKWSTDDDSRFYLTETGKAGTGIAIASTDEYATVALSATFTQESAPAEYTYAGFLSKNRTGTPYPKIPTAQTSTATSYDPNADILIAKPVTFGSAQDELSLQFARPVVINKMTLKGLDEGETISSILVSADKDITGYYNTSTNAWSGQSSEITISTSQTVPASGQVTVYFVTMPVDDATLTVTVTTGNYIYSKTFTSTINFVQDQVTRFGVASLSRVSKADYSGTYVLTNAAGTKMAGAWAGGNSIPEVNVTLDGETIYYDPDAVTIADAQIVITKITDSESAYYGMYTIEQNGKYLYAASSSNNHLKGEDVADVNAYWEISETDGNWSIVASKSSYRNVMQHNSGNKIFSCYASASQTAIALKSNFAPTPVISASASIELTSAAVSSATSTGATFNSNTATVTANAYSDAECTAAAIWLSVSTSGSGASTIVNYTATANTTGAARTEYIKITASNGSRNVSKVITVTQSAGAAVYYNKVASVTAGRTYLIVANGKAMAHPTGSSTITGTAVTISDNKITQTASTQALEFVIDNCTEDGFTSYYTMGWDVSGTMNYIYAVASNGTKFNKTTSPVYNGKGTGCWTFSSTSGYAGGSILISNVEYSSSNRVILLNGSTFGFYANSNTSYYAIDLYELDD